MTRILFTLFALIVAMGGYAKSPIKALVVTGQNNHSWEISTPYLKQLLEQSGLFTVSVAQSPAPGGDMSAFAIPFKEHDVVILDYYGDAWPESANQNFVEYVRNGGGVVVYHAANNAFPRWAEYNKITALGGWENRNEKSGPYAYWDWKEDKLIKDTSPGHGGSHGARHPYLMNGHRMDHPITQGLPTHWMHATDELYDHMRGPAHIKDVLYTAYALGGSHREEPLLFTVDYGKARILHTMIGHVMKGQPLDAVDCVGFQVTFLRGAEWAATGKVTQKVPENFPTASKISLQPLP